MEASAGRNGAVADYLSDEARAAFPDTLAARWLRACRKLAQAGYGDSVVNRYVRCSIAVARLVRPESAIDLADAVSAVAIKANRAAAEMLPVVAERAAGRLPEAPRFDSWLSLVERLAAIAPESVAPFLDHMDKLLAHLNVARLEAWVLAGIRSGGGDAARRLRFFSFADPEAERWLQREAGEIIFADMERRLKAYLNALWRIHRPMREPPVNAPEPARRRSSFDRGIIRVPASFPGYRGAQAEELYRACIAHIGAHMMYSGPRFPVRKLKPIQVALVSLVEDARVEHLAMRDFPGLRRLWLPLHVARATGALTAPSLLARLSRALIDPAFEDVDGWIRKGREMFLDSREDWENPATSRRIGDLLGNDIGQMRVQFNARRYVVEPPYRDDNLGLWDFDDDSADDTAEAELLFESVRIEEQHEEDETPPDRERDEQDDVSEDAMGHIRLDPVAAEGIPVARYPEFDYLTGRERAEWTTLVEYMPAPGPAGTIDRVLEAHADLVDRITALIGAARVSRPQRVRRQQEGEYLDMDACIAAAVSRRVGESPDPRVYGRWERRHRDLSVLVLLDISESTKDRVLGGSQSVLDVERAATALLAHAMSGLGDPFAIAAFCSNRRDDVRYYRIKDFDTPYDAMARSCLAGLEGGLSTRIGAALRHAGTDLAGQLSHRRLVLVVTDGEPSDVDVEDRAYLVEDARKAVITLAQKGIDVFCVGLDSGGDSYLTRIFGRRNVTQIDRIERLPEKLPMLYLRLTS